MLMAGSFRRLKVWQRSKALAVAVYRLTRQPPVAHALSPELVSPLLQECEEISAVLQSLIQHRRK